MRDDEPWSEEAYDDYPDPDELDDATATLFCPHCGAEVYEDAEYCPACDSYITPAARGLSRWPMWFIVLGIAGIVAAVIAMAGSMGI